MRQSVFIIEIRQQIEMFVGVCLALLILKRTHTQICVNPPTSTGMRLSVNQFPLYVMKGLEHDLLFLIL